MENESSKQTSFVRGRLPWVIAGGLLLIYLFTQHNWITIAGLPALSKATGWDWHPSYLTPLHFLVTYPIRWLPQGWQLTSFNLYGTVCAVLALALLARSVALLPHDRTRDQRAFERSPDSLLSIPAAWLPPVFAALVCGLQLTFWENAVTASGESLDLLLFAYCVRCLLEYRLDERESWLRRMAVVYGLGMANNFAMIAFLPTFIGALAWIMGRGFLDWRRHLRLVLFGLAGLLVYLVQPMFVVASNLTEQSFLDILRVNWGFQRETIVNFPRFIVLLIGLTSLLPAAFIGLKWPASFGDISAAGNALTNLMTHVIHGVFLLACLYVAFDPPFSPRKLGMGWAFLPFYYLGALAIGYCSGYFLLVFGRGQLKAWQRPTMLRKALNYGIAAMVWLAAAAAPVGLAIKNLPVLRINQGPELSRFGLTAIQSLPERGAIVLSDDPYRFYSVISALQRNQPGHRHLLVDSASLIQPAYHRFLRAKYPDRWPALPQEYALSALIDSDTLTQFMLNLSRTNEIYYLHPSFGYYFEHFYQTPRKLVYQLKPCPTNTVMTPPLTPEELRENDEFWRKYKAEELNALIANLKPADPKEQPNMYAGIMGGIYSRAVNYFGVELQKSGQLEKAGELFALAVDLSDANPSAFLNLDYNKKLREGKRENPLPSEGAANRLALYGGNWDSILGINGPVDEPNMCFMLAESLARGRNFRQAAQQLLRVIHFNPKRLDARIGLANMYVQNRLPDEALALINEIRSEPKPLEVSDQLALIQSEAWAYVAKDALPTTVAILQAAQEKYPQLSPPFSTLAEIYLATGRVTNAMEVMEKQIQSQPKNLTVYINLSALKIQAKDYTGAIALLTRALAMDPQSPASLLNRAIAYLQSDKLDEAQRDYHTLQAALTKPSYTVHYGLGEIAFRKKDAKLATDHYEEYLKLAPPGTPEVQLVNDRLRAMRAGNF